MRSFVRDLVGTLVIAIIIFLLLRLVVGSYAVISQSMEPGIQAGQRLLINKLAYKFHEPVRGDIVFYKSPDGDLDQMKRIIGLPGDIIEMHDRAVFLNGHQMTEPYVTNQAGYSIPEYQVPPGTYFVLGDNRNNSNDSSAGWTVPSDNLVGQACIFTWPPDKWGSVGNYNLSSQLTAASLND